MGIEPTEDVTRLPNGFEDQGVHQYLIRPRINSVTYTIISTSTYIARGELIESLFYNWNGWTY